MAGSSERELEFDFYDHMDGIWKRNLEWRHFGQAYQHLRTSNTIVQINKHTSRKNGRQFLTWSFGLDLSQTSMKFGYVMKLDPLVRERLSVEQPNRHLHVCCACALAFRAALDCVVSICELRAVYCFVYIWMQYVS